jgi:hypothetical protein
VIIQTVVSGVGVAPAWKHNRGTHGGKLERASEAISGSL